MEMLNKLIPEPHPWDDPDYYTNFANFEKLIAERKNLTPQMFYECPDFEVVFEIRR